MKGTLTIRSPKLLNFFLDQNDVRLQVPRRFNLTSFTSPVL